MKLNSLKFVHCKLDSGFFLIQGIQFHFYLIIHLIFVIIIIFKMLYHIYYLTGYVFSKNPIWVSVVEEQWFHIHARVPG